MLLFVPRYINRDTVTKHSASTTQPRPLLQEQMMDKGKRSRSSRARVVVDDHHHHHRRCVLPQEAAMMAAIDIEHSPETMTTARRTRRLLVPSTFLTVGGRGSGGKTPLQVNHRRIITPRTTLPCSRTLHREYPPTISRRAAFVLACRRNRSTTKITSRLSRTRATCPRFSAVVSMVPLIITRLLPSQAAKWQPPMLHGGRKRSSFQRKSGRHDE